MGIPLLPLLSNAAPVILASLFPCSILAIIALCQVYDYITARIPGIGLRERPFIGRLGAVVFLTLSIVAFGLYSPLAYGNPWTKSACNQVKLFDTWDWDCNTFFNEVNEFHIPPRQLPRRGRQAS